MKAFTVAAIVALASVATAQLDAIPSCALNCFIGPLGSDGCSSLTDFACHCKKGAELLSKVQPCVQGACSSADQATTIAAVQKTCADAGAPITIPNVSSAAPAVSSAAASAASSAASAASSAVASIKSSVASAASSAASAASSAAASAASSAASRASSAAASATGSPAATFTGAAAHATQAAGLIGAAALAMLAL